MKNRLLKDAFGWGFALWTIGYLLGIVLFILIPPPALGWVIMPLGILITLWVLLKKIKTDSFRYFVWLSISWTLIAVICDYFLLVKIFHPADGYYKLDVYIYYLLTFSLPLLVGWKRSAKSNKID